jgi:hypothetical protein
VDADRSPACGSEPSILPAVCRDNLRGFRCWRSGPARFVTGDLFSGADGRLFRRDRFEARFAWRASDSLSIRALVRVALDESVPDHSTISRTRRLMDLETHQAAFQCGCCRCWLKRSC